VHKLLVVACAVLAALLPTAAMSAVVSITLERTGGIVTGTRFNPDEDIIGVLPETIILSFDTDDVSGVPGNFDLGTQLPLPQGLDVGFLPFVDLGGAFLLEAFNTGGSIDVNDQDFYNVGASSAELIFGNDAGLPTGTLTEFQLFLANLSAVDLTLSFSLSFFDNTDRCLRDGICRRGTSDLSVFYSVADTAPEVPLPAAAWFMMTGIVGYFASRRIKK